ncbi:hypothetical protein ACHAXM_002696 [Skeletonema potamos]
MPSILKKLFSRSSSKDPEAAGFLSSSHYGAVVGSSSSDPFRQQQQRMQQRQQRQQQQFTKKEIKKQEKLAKKEAKRCAKLQKKKDKLGSFSNNVGELPDKSKFRSSNNNNINNGGQLGPPNAAMNARSSYMQQQQQQQQMMRQSRQPTESMRGGEMMEEKENSPASYRQQQYFQQQQQQPPQLRVAAIAAASSQPSQSQVLSPSSQGSRGVGNQKPPLTTHQNHHHRRGSPQQQHPYHQGTPTSIPSPQSTDSNEGSMLRGVAIHVTNSHLEDDEYEQESAMLCFSNSYDDEEYNAVALATAMGVHAAGIANGQPPAESQHYMNGQKKKGTMVDPNGDMMEEQSNNTNNHHQYQHHHHPANQMKKDKEEKFVSVLDRSPFSFTSDDGTNALFPALVGDDGDPFRQQKKQMMMMQQQQGRQGNGPQEEDLMAWTPTGADVANMGNFAFRDVPPPPPPPPKELPVIGFDPSFADFESFGDYSAFPTVAASAAATTTNGNNYDKTTVQPSSKSVGGHNNVMSILEETRLKRKTSRNNNSSSSNNSVGQSSPPMMNGGSINSAPAITSSYVRNQVQRSKGGSISRVIDNLELHVNKRQGGAPSGTSNNSVTGGGGVGGSASAGDLLREAKERIRRENMSQDSKIIDMLAAGNTAGAVAVAKSNNNSENWLFDEVTGALGPRSVAADLESLGGRSNRSGKSRNSHRSHRSKKSSRGGSGGGRHRSKGNMMGSDVSVDSRTSRNSYRSYKSTRSMVSQMSEQSRSVANDLLRLEAQLSMVGKSRREGSGGGGSGSVSGSSVKSRGGIVTSGSSSVVSKQRDDCGATVSSRDFSVGRSSHHSSRQHISASARKAAVRSLRSKVTIVAPPGKLGIILANRTDSRGTVVSGVRTASVLATQISPGDRIIAIDDEDVSQMNVKEITTIMTRKSEFDRVLTLLAAPKMQYD